MVKTQSLHPQANQQRLFAMIIRIVILGHAAVHVQDMAASNHGINKDVAVNYAQICFNPCRCRCGDDRQLALWG